MHGDQHELTDLILAVYKFKLPITKIMWTDKQLLTFH